MINISHLTTIVRIGAKATEALDLFAMGAVNFYQTYPEEVRDPLETFQRGVNAAGATLGSNDSRQEVRQLSRPGPGCRRRTLRGRLVAHVRCRCVAGVAPAVAARPRVQAADVAGASCGPRAL